MLAEALLGFILVPFVWGLICSALAWLGVPFLEDASWIVSGAAASTLANGMLRDHFRRGLHENLLRSPATYGFVLTYGAAVAVACAIPFSMVSFFDGVDILIAAGILVFAAVLWFAPAFLPRGRRAPG